MSSIHTLRYLLLVLSSLLVIETHVINYSFRCNNYNIPCQKEQHLLDISCGYKYQHFMSELESKLINSFQRDFHDPTRCTYYKDFDIKEVDFIVIGAGCAGSVVASRLSENPDVSVVLLEAGPSAPAGTQVCSMYSNNLGNPKMDWNYQLIPEEHVCLQNHGICHNPRGKVMGGTCSLNGMMYMRGNPEDYNILKDDGIEGWSYDDVLPYFKKSENNLDINEPWIDKDFHGTSGPLTISTFNHHPEFAETLVHSWCELVYKDNYTDCATTAYRDLNGKSQRGFTIAQATTRNGTRETTAKAFLYKQIEERKNLLVIPNANVQKININPETFTAESVTYVRNGEKQCLKARKEVIVSAGTIASPQLLLLSGLGPKEDLDSVGVTVAKNMPGVGQNLNNHASTEIIFRIENSSNFQQLNNDTINEFFNERKGPLTSTGLSQVTGFVWINQSDMRPDLQMFHAGFNANCSFTGSTGEKVDTDPHRRFSVSSTLLNAKSTGWVKLLNQYPESLPQIWGNILGEKEDRDMLLAGVELAVKLPDTTEMKQQGVMLEQTFVKDCEHLEWNTTEYWQCYIAYKTNPENHLVGTCKMGGPQDKMAVVDNKLRVHGIGNLRVCDASIFPRTPSGNTQAPTIMVAERCANFIQEEYNIPK